MTKKNNLIFEILLHRLFIIMSHIVRHTMDELIKRRTPLKMAHITQIVYARSHPVHIDRNR